MKFSARFSHSRVMIETAAVLDQSKIYKVISCPQSLYLHFENTEILGHDRTVIPTHQQDQCIHNTPQQVALT